MKVNFFKQIRRSYTMSTILTTVLCNVMVFGQPIGQLTANNELAFIAFNFWETNYDSTLTNHETYKVADSSNRKFYANQGLGVIGTLNVLERDNPRDNYFLVELPSKEILEDYNPVLIYDLKGLNLGSQTTKIVNGSKAYGGVNIESNDEWKTIEEPISKSVLRTGKNTIVFNRRTEYNYQYKIKNVYIELKEKSKSKIQLLDTNLKVSSNGKLHLVGFVDDTNIDKISVGNSVIKVIDGMFEGFLSDLPSCLETLRVSFNDETGKLFQENFAVKYDKRADNKTIDNLTTIVSSKTFQFLEDEEQEVFLFKSLGISKANSSLNYNNDKLKVDVLSFKDIHPVNSDIDNVTKGKYTGYKIRRSNGNLNPLKISLSYDDIKIPEGYTAKDVRTFYFDDAQFNWKALPVDSIDYDKKEIVSTITNQTDFINGVIKVPESPETGSFAPTMISDMEYANPASAIVSISPPSPNNMGTANTSFPIKLPAGRQGMQPSLSINYNSEGGNGWMGLGWNLAMPSISLNTKWGAPLFDGSIESELYSLNGEDLVLKHGEQYTNPHRTENISRISERTFYLRKEASYVKITRHGNSVANYWWEVVDKQGNKSFYGGYNGLSDNAVIKTTDGQIAHWALKRTQDPSGNYVEYIYDKSASTIGDSQVASTEFYIDKIRYTMHANANDHYEVDFFRNTYSLGSNSSFTARKDIMTNARNGFIWSTKDLLTEIKIYKKGSQTELIRSYRFDYQERKFLKQQLTKVSEYDTGNKLFYSNTLEYFEDITNDSSLLNSGENTWQGPQDGIGLSLPGNIVGRLEGSTLGTSKSVGTSAGLRAGFGLGGNVKSKNFSVGAGFSYNRTEQSGLIGFQDVNGDGLPDKIFDRGANFGLRYRANTGTGFSTQVYNLNGVNELNETISRTNGFAFDAIFYGNLGYSRNTTRSRTDRYFIDMNGDGLADMVQSNGIKFNSSPSGNNFTRTFTSNVNNTENPILPGSINQNIVDDLEFPTLIELQEENSQFDVVQVWQAPYDGTVSVSSIARVNNLNNNNGENNQVKFLLEKTSGDENQNNTRIRSSILTSSNSSIPINTSFSVAKGNYVFFRTHNDNFGSGAETSWQPRIQYTNLPDELEYTDETGKDNRIYDSKEDFILTNGNAFEVSETEQNVRIRTNLSQSSYDAFEFSDDIKFIIKKVRYDLRENTYGNVLSSNIINQNTYRYLSGNMSGGPQINEDLFVTETHKDVLEFWVTTTSNIAWDRVKWKPTIEMDGDTFYPEVNHKIYNDNPSSFSSFIPSEDLPCPMITPNPTGGDDGNAPYLRISHNLNDFDYGFLEEIHQEQELSFPISINIIAKEKINGVEKLRGQRTFKIFRNTNGTYFTQNTSSDIVLNKNHLNTITENQENGLFVSMFTDVKEVAYELQESNLEIDLHLGNVDSCNIVWDPIVLTQPFYTTNSNYFGSYYRGWGQFLYNGSVQLARNENNDIIFDGNSPRVEEDFGNLKIDMSIFMNNGEAMQVSQIDEDTHPDDIDGLNRTIRYTQFNQDNESGNYLSESIETSHGIDTNGNIKTELARFGEDNLYDIFIDPNTITSSNTFIGLKQYSKSKGDGVSAGAFILNETVSFSNSEILNQYVDLNGDRYPDIVTKNNIQYTNSLGALSLTRSNDFIIKNKSSDIYTGVSFGFNPNSTSSTNGNDTGNKTNTQVNAGVGANVGRSFDETLWIDINGDGLSDKVRLDEENQTIITNLNSGYAFSNDIIWGSGFDLLASTNVSPSISPSFPLDESGSFALGAGASTSTAIRKSNFIDVNGDGLPEIVIKESGNFKYYLNNGNGFDAIARTFYTGNQIAEDKSTSVNIFGTATFGFPIQLFLLTFKAVFTANLGASSSFNQKNISVQDINGDGYPDILTRGTTDTQISARLSKIDRTHLLKKVNTPLGGSWEVDYTRDDNSYEMPQSKWLLTEIITNDGFSGDNAYGLDQTLTTATYDNPKYDRRERTFYGYERLRVEQRNPTNESLYRYSERWIHNNNYYLKGAEKMSGMFDASGEKLSEKYTFYNLLNPESPQANAEINTDINSYYSQGFLDEDKSRIFVAIVKTINSNYEDGQSLSATQKFIHYDSYGNLTKAVDIGTGGEDSFWTNIIYDENSQVENGFGFPTSVRVFQSGTNELLRSRQATYDSQGKLEQITTHLNFNDFNRVNFSYDAFGNITRVDQLDNLRANSGDTFFTTIDYDPFVHTYPIKVSDAFEQSSLMTYNFLFGIPIYTTDMNNHSMRTRLDNRGRVVEITGPKELELESNSPRWTIRTQYEGETLFNNPINIVPPVEAMFFAQGAFEPSTDRQHHAITKHYDPAITNNEMLTVSIVDGLGKAIQLKKTHVSGIGTNESTKWLLSGKETKDAFGRTIKSYLTTIQNDYPTSFSNITVAHLNYIPGIPSIAPQTMSYDTKDRQVEVNLPDGHEMEMDYGIQGNFFTTRSSQLVNGESQTMTSFTDVRGRNRKTIQNDELTTQYDYNAINELVKVTNNEGHVTNSIYDIAGRRIEVQHPDQGSTILTYDKASNVIKRKTSNLMLTGGQQEITYDYNFNRLIAISYPQNPENNVEYTYGSPTNEDALEANAVGRLFLQKDATGIQLFGYGNMGELNRNLRTAAVAGERSYWFLTQWVYDSWNRLLQITYPDEETVTYNYNKAGNLKSIVSEIPSFPVLEDIISDINYTDFGERAQTTFGNGTTTNYTYDVRRRMNTVDHQFNGFQIKKDYDYDGVSNITGIQTLTPGNSLPDAGEIGGPVNHTYSYDNYNRLVQANGNYIGANDETTPYLKQEYTLEMEYDLSHRIVGKSQTHQRGIVSSLTAPIQDAQIVGKTDYSLSYQDYATGAYVAGTNYGYQQPHAPRAIIERPTNMPASVSESPMIKNKVIDYDANGNQTAIKEVVGDTEITLRENLWDEDNRLKAVDLNPENNKNHPIAVYAYDAGGERVVKYNWDGLNVHSNANDVARVQQANTHIYPSGMLVAKVVNEKQSEALLKYTKHYYAGSERVHTKLGTMTKLGDYPLKNVSSAFQNAAHNTIKNLNASRDGVAASYVVNAHTAFDIGISLASPVNASDISSYSHNTKNYDAYWYHSDHLGSSNYITNLDGVVSQHMEYMPFGELLVDEHLNSNNSIYKFNSKELDNETGNYYYSARYYDPKLSIWLSVDPLAEKYPEWSPYNYVMQNPVKLIDPTGMSAENSNCGCPPDCSGNDFISTFKNALSAIFTWPSFSSEEEINDHQQVRQFISDKVTKNKDSKKEQSSSYENNTVDLKEQGREWMKENVPYTYEEIEQMMYTEAGLDYEFYKNFKAVTFPKENNRTGNGEDLKNAMIMLHSYVESSERYQDFAKQYTLILFGDGNVFDKVSKIHNLGNKFSINPLDKSDILNRYYELNPGLQHLRDE